jgi:hypothetical protein
MPLLALTNVWSFLSERQQLKASRQVRRSFSRMSGLGGRPTPLVGASLRWVVTPSGPGTLIRLGLDPASIRNKSKSRAPLALRIINNVFKLVRHNRQKVTQWIFNDQYFRRVLRVDFFSASVCRLCSQKTFGLDITRTKILACNSGVRCVAFLSWDPRSAWPFWIRLFSFVSGRAGLVNIAHWVRAESCT